MEQSCFTGLCKLEMFWAAAAVCGIMNCWLGIQSNIPGPGYPAVCLCCLFGNAFIVVSADAIGISRIFALKP